jgi:hypothetical protein
MDWEYIGEIVMVSIICLIGAIAGIRKMKKDEEINRLADERIEREAAIKLKAAEQMSKPDPYYTDPAPPRA